ncbi:hypothetical protein NESM_000214700 [Novymonas esmeraldas]|uniref:Uncharacterized protein n=1 Tax=Novymonas esmeraldas TaxID=1808958 RepID=A0AAW0F990_9TRYP
MEEFAVLKQGRWRTANWTARVLSIHSRLGLAAITARDNAGDTLHHGMRVTSVVIWPLYGEKRIKESFDSMEARLTVRVTGVAATVRPRGTDGGTDAVPHYTYTSTGAKSDMQTWMLRFLNYDDLERALRLLHAVKPCLRALRAPAGAEAPRQQPEGVDSSSPTGVMTGWVLNTTSSRSGESGS